MNESELSYGIFLSESQLDFLYKYPQGFNRMKCFVTFLRLAVKEPTHYIKGKFEVDLTPGQFAISEVELAKLLDCNRKTAGKMAVLFHNAGLVTSVSNAFTTIFTIPCLACWYEGDKQYVSKVYSRHHVFSARTAIIRKNNKSKSKGIEKDPDDAIQEESTAQAMSVNESPQVVTTAENKGNLETVSSPSQDAISNDAHERAKDDLTEVLPVPYSFDGNANEENASSHVSDTEFTHPSIQETSSPHIDETYDTHTAEVTDTSEKSSGTSVNYASLTERPTHSDNVPTNANNGTTVAPSIEELSTQEEGL